MYMYGLTVAALGRFIALEDLHETRPEKVQALISSEVVYILGSDEQGGKEIINSFSFARIRSCRSIPERESHQPTHVSTSLLGRIRSIPERESTDPPTCPPAVSAACSLRVWWLLSRCNMNNLRLLHIHVIYMST